MIISKITLFQNEKFSKKNFWNIQKKFFFKSRQIMLKKSDFQKFGKKKFEKKFFEKKNFFWSWIFCKNRHKIAKNWQIDKIKTFPNRQDFGLSRKYFEMLEITFFEHNLARFVEIFFEKFSFWKKLFFEHYFSFLIGFTCTNNLSMVLLLSLLKKFLCDMHTHWAPTHLKTAVCS